MKKKNILCCLIGLISIGVLGGCGNEEVSKDDSNAKDESSSSEINVIKNDKLAVDQNKCIGCGKCVRIAPDNFEMNKETHKAQVKSNEITDQYKINNAVQSCHLRAITQ